LLSTYSGQGNVEFWSSALPSVAHRQFSQLWGESVNVFKM